MTAWMKMTQRCLTIFCRESKNKTGALYGQYNAHFSKIALSYIKALKRGGVRTLLS
jgi:hypothetical protein